MLIPKAKLFVALVLALAFSCTSLPPCKAAPGFLHRSSTSIIDSNGNIVFLRGVNLGNWLYNEPWMMAGAPFDNYDGGAKPDRFHDALVLATGSQAAANQFLTDWRDRFIQKSDINLIAHLGFNSVRVPLDYRLFYDPETQQDSNVGFTYLDRLISWCAADHVYVIPDMHSVPGGKKNDDPLDIYQDQVNQAILSHIWKRIAERYSDNPTIGGWDLVNEPTCWDTTNWTLSKLYKRLTSAIRSVDQNHLIIIEGDHWASRLDLIGPGDQTQVGPNGAPSGRWDENMALSDHAYGNKLPDQPQLDGSFAASTFPGHLKLEKQLDMPLWSGEFGYNSNVWLRQAEVLWRKAEPSSTWPSVNSQSSGFCLWSYKSADIWSIVNIRFPDSYRGLVTYWNSVKSGGANSAPSASDAVKALQDLTISAQFEHCTVNRDVVDALNRPDFLNHSKPFLPGLVIPGTIPAVDYDLGNEDVAYHNAVYDDEAESGPAGTAWNSGWAFRNDGVDIFPLPSKIGDIGYYIGNVQPGDWTAYTVHCRPGNYDIELRYMAASNSSIAISLDGKPLINAMLLPSTGGFNKVGTISSKEVAITSSGFANLRITANTSGFNWISVQFIPTGS